MAETKLPLPPTGVAGAVTDDRNKAEETRQAEKRKQMEKKFGAEALRDVSEKFNAFHNAWNLFKVDYDTVKNAGRTIDQISNETFGVWKTKLSKLKTLGSEVRKSATSSNMPIEEADYSTREGVEHNVGISLVKMNDQLKRLEKFLDEEEKRRKTAA